MKNLIVVPAFNEEEALPKALADLQALPAEYEIVIVDDGSTDGTGAAADAVARLPVHVLHLACNLGIGGAVQAGYRFAAQRGGYEFVVQFDADGQHSASDVPLLVEACRQRGLDLCIGSRFLTPGGFRSSAARRVGIRFFARLIGALAGVPVTDPTSGLRCAGPRAWRLFAERYPDDYPEPETLFWCARHGLSVGEIAVAMRPRQGGVSSIRHGRMLYYMVKVSLAIVVDRLRPREDGRR